MNIEKVIGYALLDNISCEIIATKTKLDEIMDFVKDNQKQSFKNTNPIIIEIINSDGKNILGNRIN